MAGFEVITEASDSEVFFLGVHDAAERVARRLPSLIENAGTQNIKLLAGMEYASRPDIVGGPLSLLRIDSDGIAVSSPGACSAEQIGPRPGKPGTLLAAGLAPDLPAGELDRRISAVPNIVCHEATTRYSKRGTQLQADTIQAEVSIADAKEVYSQINRNGKAYKQISDLPGAWTEGELSSMLRVTRNAIKNHDSMVTSRVNAHGETEFGVVFCVEASENAWTLYVSTEHFAAGIQGEAWFSGYSGALAEITWKSLDLVVPARLGITQIIWTTTFHEVKGADGDFVVPYQAVYRVVYRDYLHRADWTEGQFTNYRHFGAVTKIHFD